MALWTQANIESYAGDFERRGGIWLQAAQELRAQAIVGADNYALYMEIFNRYVGYSQAGTTPPPLPQATQGIPWLLLGIGAIALAWRAVRKKK